MSFDLYFVKHKNIAISKKEVIAHISDLPNFTVQKQNDEAMEIFYQNEDTGVYFMLDVGTPSPELEKDDTVPPDYDDTGISINLNYARPSFFAYESMPIAADIAVHFGLSVFDPQREKITSPPDVDELVASWKESNNFAVESYIKQGSSLPYMEHEKATTWWTYMKNKQRLERQLTCFVPKVFLAKEDSTVATYLTWGEGVVQVFPESDYLILMGFKDSRFGKTTELEPKGVLKYRDACAVLDPYFRSVDIGEIPSLKMIHEEDVFSAREKVEELQRKPFVEFEPIQSDQFVDVLVKA
jgi:hypothetical protein